MKNKSLVSASSFLILSFFMLSSCSSDELNIIQNIINPKTETVKTETSLNKENSKNTNIDPKTEAIIKEIQKKKEESKSLLNDESLTPTSKEAMTFLLSIYDDEIFYRDIETILDQKFLKLSTKSKSIEKNNYKTLATTPSGTTKQTEDTLGILNKTVEKIVFNQKISDEMLKNSAITQNADNTFTINFELVNNVIEKNLNSLQTRVMMNVYDIQKRFENLSPLIKFELLKTEIIKEEDLIKIERKDNEIKASSIQDLTNGDGSISKIIYVSFIDRKEGLLSREAKISKTYFENKLVSIESEIIISAGKYIRKARRFIKINDDSSRTVYTDSETLWPNSRKLNFYEEESFDSTGLLKYSGIAKITDLTKYKKYYVLDTNINKDLNIIDIILSDVEENTEIKLQNKFENDIETLEFILNINGKNINIPIF